MRNRVLASLSSIDYQCYDVIAEAEEVGHHAFARVRMKINLEAHKKRHIRRALECARFYPKKLIVD